ncbi:MAG: ammonia-forming cytochrome c nitrite reductase subunit c552 [Anaerolineae bacterium]|nr:ammonia-forming cytochrome c nitrite reductase subunit c552 [Anaerolineae bacterium]NUQ04127.1 ammonia-forming cytochrome c nitrite reductase subunit c552 [Anaerolineae bacterium]
MNRTRQFIIYILVFAGAVVLTAGVAALLVNINQRQTEALQSPLRIVEIGEDELDPAVWGQNFPIQYEMFTRTEEDYGRTPYGGSEPYSKLENNPAMVRLWAGYAFSIDHNEERGHYYALIDQQQTRRVTERNQPGACANCHAAETPMLIAEMGWEEFNHTPYNDLSVNLHRGSTCHDCHDPETMELVITRPAFLNAMEARGIDLSEATRQEMRTYVCAQCHVEYYFAGENKVLTFPWTNGLSIDNIQEYYTEVSFTDWQHAEAGSPMLKMQHPEFELYSSGIHYQSGVACADCHMPYTRVGSQKVSDHWVRSPLSNLSAACQTCHNVSEEELNARVVGIQDVTAELLRQSEEALLSAIDAIVAAQAAGATEEQLAPARELHRFAQMRWDFISSENSTGFHSPQEAARVLADSIDLARQAQLAAVQLSVGTATSNTSFGG